MAPQTHEEYWMTQFSLTMNDGTELSWVSPDPELFIAGDHEEFNWLLTLEEE